MKRGEGSSSSLISHFITEWKITHFVSRVVKHRHWFLSGFSYSLPPPQPQQCEFFSCYVKDHSATDKPASSLSSRKIPFFLRQCKGTYAFSKCFCYTSKTLGMKGFSVSPEVHQTASVVFIWWQNSWFQVTVLSSVGQTTSQLVEE